MSHRLISRSRDLTRLRDEGYDLHIVEGHLVVEHVPYLDREGRVQHGALICALTLSGDQTSRPDDHVAYFQGSEPCDRSGQPLARVINSACPDKELATGLPVGFMLSNKPPGGYPDYHAKITTYVTLLLQHALLIDPEATAYAFPVARDDTEESPFTYLDTASSRAGVSSIVARLAGMRIAIIGVGGTGSYILDLVTKCPVAEIHIYDNDLLLQHNAFRFPGAIGLITLEAVPNKAECLAKIYQQIHRGVIAHPYRIDSQTHTELADLDFVFIAIDDNDARAEITTALQGHGIPFIDVGIGMQTRTMKSGHATLGGSVRTTLVDWDPTRNHTARIPTRSHDEQNDYTANIQIVEINALNAALAVVRWKRFFGIYDDLEYERHSIYDIDGNIITNADQPDESSDRDPH